MRLTASSVRSVAVVVDDDHQFGGEQWALAHRLAGERRVLDR